MRVSQIFSSPRGLDHGLLAALGSSLIWGALPLYWYLLREMPSFLILCHRAVWGGLFLFLLVFLTHRMGEVVRAGRDARTLRTLFCGSFFLACNWGVYIWAVNHGRVTEASLGYYISPLLTICLGVAVFRDRPRRMQRISIAVAVLGVAAEIAINGVVPWVALILSVSFSIYAVLRKIAPVEALPGLTLETAILLPFALGFIVLGGPGLGEGFGTNAWGKNTSETLLLAGSGVITTIPLMLYAYGARHVPFTTLGVLQYIAPTCSAMIGFLVFREPFTVGRMISFTAIWIALAVYTMDSIRAHRRRTMQQPGSPRRSGTG